MADGSSSSASAPGLVAAYAFDGGAGTSASDASGNNRTGTIVGAGWTAGKFGSAVGLNGNGDRVDLPALGTFYKNAVTLEAWVGITSSGAPGATPRTSIPNVDPEDVRSQLETVH